MGIYDRDYSRDARPLFSVRGPRTVIGWIVLANVLLFVADHLVPAGEGPGRMRAISDALALRLEYLTQPLQWYRFVTYGFVHVPNYLMHILGNMIGLFFLGRGIEQLLGGREFARFYLVAVLLGGMVWAVVSRLVGVPAFLPLVGASGAVVAVTILFALNFPHQKILLFPFPFSIPAWVLGIFIVANDLLGVLQLKGMSNTAFSVHLTGAAFALAYWRFHWRLARFTDWGGALKTLRSRPHLRVHRPEESDDEERLMQQADEILAKIHREGLESLTRKERRLLEAASRRVQRRRQTKVE